MGGNKEGGATTSEFRVEGEERIVVRRTGFNVCGKLRIVSSIGLGLLTLHVPDVLQGYRGIANPRGTATNRTAVLRADARLPDI